MSSKIIPASLFMSVLIITCPSFCVEEGDILSQIEEKYSNYYDLKAEFLQESYNATSETVKKASGLYYARKPNLMRWKYIEPEEQYFIVDGKFLWFYSVADKQVIKSDIQKTNEGIKEFMKFLSSIKNLKKDFYITIEKNDKELKLQMNPKKRLSGLSKLNLFLNPENFDLIKTEQYDQFNNKNTIHFKKIEVNVGLEDELFRFVVPKGVEVIEN